ncbi:unnamed protein product, partial [Larinioides sclopetarius]
DELLFSFEPRYNPNDGSINTNHQLIHFPSKLRDQRQSSSLEVIHTVWDWRMIFDKSESEGSVYSFKYKIAGVVRNFISQYIL